MTNAASGANADALNHVREQLLDMLVEANEGKFDRAEIVATANFLDYGYIDSLTGVAFLAKIEERYGIEIDDLAVVERLNTLEALAEHVASHQR